MTHYKTSIALSDGRRLHYFDSSDGRVAQDDTRGLPRQASRGEIRFDSLNGEWVTVAGHRQSRTFLPSAAMCPLCPSSGGNQTEIPDSSYEVVIFDNRFPSLADPGPGWSMPTPDLLARGPNAGHCEVVCFTDAHDSRFANLSPERVRLVIEAWQDRTADLLSKPYVEYVFVFENYGKDIGVTISHPHGQIYAYPFIPSRARQTLEIAASNYESTGEHVLDRLVDAERDDGARIVDETDHWVAFVPFAARWPFQLQIHPKAPVSDFTGLTEPMVDELATLYPRSLQRFSGLFDQEVPYIAAWNQAPKGPLGKWGRLYLDIFTTRRDTDKLKYLAGSESAMGAFVNDVSPEDAAAMLRSALGEGS